jgi:hypothetical protein
MFTVILGESITTVARKQTNSWHITISKTLQTHQNLFLSQDNGGDLVFGLADNDLTNIKPSYEALKVGQKDESK